MTANKNEKALEAVKTVAQAIYFLEQTAIDARDSWRSAKEGADEVSMKAHRKLKVEIHSLKKKAVLSLLSQGFGKIQGYYKCVEAYGEPHFVSIEICGYEFLIPIKRKICKDLTFLGDRGLVKKDASFKGNITVGRAFFLVHTYLNPNYENDMKEKKKKKGKINPKHNNKKMVV